MLHDIGIFYADAPEIGCHGNYHYLCHGYLGRALMEKHGLAAHGRVCERHVGVGLTASDIISQGLPLPVRDMVPDTIEEQIICFVDTFYSKTPPPAGKRRSPEEVIAALAPYGAGKVDTFRTWLKRFGAETREWPMRPEPEPDANPNGDS